MNDYHLHSSISFDSDAGISDMCTAAVHLGLKEVCFTEHIDLDHPKDAAAIDFDAYRQQLRDAREEFPQLAIKKGIEIGLIQHVNSLYPSMLADKNLDFIIASQHAVNGDDPYYPSFFDGRTQRQAYESYLVELYDNIRDFSCYSVVGHIGYVAKFRSGPYNLLTYGMFPDLLDAILKNVIEKGKGIEVNTSGLLRTAEPFPARDILKRYREFGGEILTVGSDAHSPEDVGYMINETMAALKDIGFRYTCTYDRLKPTFVKI